MAGGRPLLALDRKPSKALHALADEIDNHQKNLDVAKLSFSVTGAAGGIMTIAGLLLTPVIFGAPLGLAIAGGVVGGISAAGNIGSLVADKVITSTAIKNAQKELDALAVKSESVKNILSELIAKLNEKEKHYFLQWLLNIKIEPEVMDLIQTMFKVASKDNVNCLSETIILEEEQKYDSIIQMAKTLCKWLRQAEEALDVLKNGIGAAAKVASQGNAANAAKAVGSTADAGSDALKTAGKTFSGAKNVGIAFAGMGLAFDLGAIVYYSMKVHKMEPCKVAENIREVARRLE